MSHCDYSQVFFVKQKKKLLSVKRGSTHVLFNSICFYNNFFNFICSLQGTLVQLEKSHVQFTHTFLSGSQHSPHWRREGDALVPYDIGLKGSYDFFNFF